MTETCRLKIQTDTLQVELTGDASFVRSGYLALREDIMGRLRAASRTGSRAVGTSSARAAVARGADAPPPAEPGPDYLWVYRCNDLYNKVYVLERRQLRARGLGRFVDLARVQRIYVESKHARAIEAVVPAGETLWSELTGLGHERLRER